MLVCLIWVFGFGVVLLLLCLRVFDGGYVVCLVVFCYLLIVLALRRWMEWSNVWFCACRIVYLLLLLLWVLVVVVCCDLLFVLGVVVACVFMLLFDTIVLLVYLLLFVYRWVVGLLVWGLELLVLIVVCWLVFITLVCLCVLSCRFNSVVVILVFNFYLVCCMGLIWPVVCIVLFAGWFGFC